MQNAVQEEDRSKNGMIFELPAELDEELNVAVGEVFQAIGKKPRTFGRKQSDKAARLVKVTCSSSTVLGNILANVKRLKVEENVVFVSPDRFPPKELQPREQINDIKRLTLVELDKIIFLLLLKVVKYAVCNLMCVISV